MFSNVITVIVSALFYGLAYWYPALFWWGTLISTAMLIALHKSPHSFFWYSFLWAIIAYAMHGYAVISGIAHLAAYNAWYAWLPGIVLLIYLSLVTAFFWSVGVWCEQKMLLSLSIFFHYFFWSFWLAVYWLLMTYLIFWPAGRCEGYLLLNPIIPWAIHPVLLYLLPCIGVIGMTFLICGIAGALVYDSIKQQHMLVGAFVVAIIAIVSLLYDSDEKAHSLLPIAHVPKIIQQSDDDDALCNLIHDYVGLASESVHDCCGAVFPESSVYAWQICAHSLRADPAHAEIRDYIIGSFFDDNGMYRNSCYWLRDGVLQQRYDKRHAMPLIERMPWWLKRTRLYTLFFASRPEIVPSNNEHPLMMIGEHVVVPYICSELFFNRTPDDAHTSTPLVALVNDRWCYASYLQDLLYLGAVVQAYAWQRTILYVSYTRCRLIVWPEISTIVFRSPVWDLKRLFL